MRAEDTVVPLLAAGRALRFGAADKPAQPLWGRPLAEHAVAALAQGRFAVRIAVVSGAAVDFAAHG